MMKVIAVRDRGWFDDIQDHTLFQQTCSAYQVDFEFVNELDEISPSENLIVFVEDGDVTLEEFVHPENATYLFGRAGMDLSLYYKDKTRVRIQVPDTRHPLFGHVACGIVLEDRKRKLWQ